MQRRRGFVTLALLAITASPLVPPQELLAEPAGLALLQAQGVVEGMVVDRATRRPLVGAQVFIEGTQIGALTNSTGRYRIANVPAGSVTVGIRMLGYGAATRTVQLASGQTATANFELGQEALALDAVVVTGTPGGTQRKAIGNVVERVDAQVRIETAPATNVNQLLSQQAPGLITPGMGGMVGTGSAIRIRGISSMTLGSQPILVVDGVRVDNNPSAGPPLRGGGQTSRINDFNPEDIESIEIIKGPAAATLYGTEAANGVIQIITKKGASGAPNLDVTVRQGTNWLPDAEDRLLTTYFYDPKVGAVTDSMNVLRRYREMTGEDLFQKGWLQSYTASLRGGTDLVRYYTSMDWDDEEGIVDYNWNKRFGTRANVSLHPGETWDFNASLGFVRSETRFAQAATGLDIWSLVFWTRPDTCNTPTRCFRYAPPEAAAQVDSRSRFSRFTGSFQINNNPVSWLHQRFIMGLDYGSDVSTQLFPRVPEGETNFFGARGVGEKRVDNTSTVYNSFDYAITANFAVSPSLSGSTSAGVQYNRRQVERSMALGKNFPATAITTVGGAAVTTGGEAWEENKTLGTFLQQQIAWRDRVFLTAAIRGDDNSAFGADFEAALYPKLSATWMLSDESFFDFDWVNQLRLRTAWGQAGMQPGVFDAVTLFTPLTGPGNQPVLTPRTLGNPGLKPEVGEELELGFDLALLDERLSVEYTYFDKATKDALVARQLRPSSGFPGFQMVNLGLVKNWGHELALNALLVDLERVGFDLGVNLATHENRVMDMGGVETQPGHGTRNRVGYPINTFFAQKALSGELVNGKPVNMMCDGGTGEHGADMGGPAVPCDKAPVLAWGSVQPTWSGSVSTGLRLGENLRLNSLTEFQGGHVGISMLAGAHRSMNSTFAVNPITDARIAWYLTRGNNNIPGLYQAGFARLRELSATYELPQTWVSRTGASRASLNVGWRNVMFLWREEPEIWGSKVFDPEQVGQGDQRVVAQAIELPPTAQLVSTLRITF